MLPTRRAAIKARAKARIDEKPDSCRRPSRSTRVHIDCCRDQVYNEQENKRFEGPQGVFAVTKDPNDRSGGMTKAGGRRAGWLVMGVKP